MKKLRDFHFQFQVFEYVKGWLRLLWAWEPLVCIEKSLPNSMLWKWLESGFRRLRNQTRLLMGLFSANGSRSAGGSGLLVVTRSGLCACRSSWIGSEALQVDYNLDQVELISDCGLAASRMWLIMKARLGSNFVGVGEIEIKSRRHEHGRVWLEMMT